MKISEDIKAKTTLALNHFMVELQSSKIFPREHARTIADVVYMKTATEQEVSAIRNWVTKHRETLIEKIRTTSKDVPIPETEQTAKPTNSMSSGSRYKSKAAMTSSMKASNEETSAASCAADDKKTKRDIKKEDKEAGKLNSIDNNNTQQSTDSNARGIVASDEQTTKSLTMMNNMCGELQGMKIEDGEEPRGIKDEIGKNSKAEEAAQKNVKTSGQGKTKEQKKLDRATVRLAKTVAKFSTKFVSAAKDLGVIEHNQDYSSDSDSSWSSTDSASCSSSCTCSECCTTDSSTCSCSDCCSETSYTAGSSTTNSSSESSSGSSSSSPSSDTI